MSTVFTRIIDGEIPGIFVWSDEVVVAIATIEPVTAGHLMVIPRAEVSRFTDLDDDVLSHAMTVAARIGRAQIAAFDAPRATLAIAGFEVPHTHLHVMPAWSEADMQLSNAKPSTPEALTAAAEKVRAALREQGWGEFVPEDISRG